MSSEDSEDEPLAVLAAKKRNYEVEIFPVTEKKKRKKKSYSTKKSCNVTIEIQNPYSPVPIERPTDVWLYLKDLNPNGPYSCLLCSEWFINKTKIVIHYIINHKKDYCGICRYFMPDRESWLAHSKFHTPWLCSQCPETFPTEPLLRAHFSQAHNMVHCRICHTRIMDGDDYHAHLLQKHSVTNIASKNEECFWKFENENFNFLCLLCSKSNNAIQTYSNHYMAYHHMTMKCLAPLLSGKNWDFPVKGVEVSMEFLETQLKSHDKYGYMDLDKKPDRLVEKDENVALKRTATHEFITEMVKEEVLSEPEEILGTVDYDDEAGDDGAVVDNTEKKPIVEKKKLPDELLNYKGDDDFNITQVEIIMLQKCYYDYLTNTIDAIEKNTMPLVSVIDYGMADADHLVDIQCQLCSSQYTTLLAFIQHMIKMHCLKSVSTFTCRVCATTFDSASELQTHESVELGDFEDLWICQFCDREFDNREDTRKHLTEHWDLIEYDNCFSPHLGFKCKYCPTLFWNEPDRETHCVQAHIQKYLEDYYKCESCNEIFSDKVWFSHHYITNHAETDTIPIGAYLLKCCICCTVLKTVADMRSHFNDNHPEERRVFCSLDNCKFKPFCHKKSFYLHMRAYHSNKKRPDVYTCQYCSKQFNNKRSCSAHTAQAHGANGAGRFLCSLCKQQLRTADERKIHYLLSHPGRHPFQCRECDKSFQYKSSLYLHKKEHAPDKQDFKCSYCEKVFKKRESFREHIMIHEGPKHACSYCPMVFVQRSNMLRHERRHTGERPYTCQFCPKTFSDKGACSSHARVHQQQAPSFPCMYCGQTFVQKSKLTYHIRKHTGENLETCMVQSCGKIFTSGSSLREHMKTHERRDAAIPSKCPLCSKSYQDEKCMMKHLKTTHTKAKFFCPICNKKLHSGSSLREHVITHGDSKAYKCKICNKSYNIKRTMVRHLRRRHGVKHAEASLSEFYNKLDPRDINLNIDETTMNSIFGPRKNKPPLREAPNYTNKRPNLMEYANDKLMENVVLETVHVKIEPEGDMMPTDFVTVKIECADEEDRRDEYF